MYKIIKSYNLDLKLIESELNLSCHADETGEPSLYVIFFQAHSRFTSEVRR